MGGDSINRKYPRIYEIIYDTMELLISSSEMALYIYIYT